MTNFGPFDWSMYFYYLEIAQNILIRLYFLYCITLANILIDILIKTEYDHVYRTLIPAPGRTGRGFTHTQTNRPYN